MWQLNEGDLGLVLPDSILLHIFTYLHVPDIPVISKVCKSWYRVSCDEFLWKHFFYRDFQVHPSIARMPGRKSWRSEYKRLVEGVAIIETEKIDEHNHQVLHVSFSHHGKYFATSSKDGYIIVWNSTYPADVKYYKDMKVHSWKYTQYSQFNSTDTLLLVSGVHFGSFSSTSGEIAVFNLEKDFQLQCRVLNRPYDIFGTWYNDLYLLSGDLHWLAHLVSGSAIWLNKARQETDSEHHAIINRLYRFYNRNASSVRTILVANCLTADTPADACGQEKLDKKQDPKAKEHGNPPSYRELSALEASARLYEGVSAAEANRPVYTSPITYTTDYRQAENVSTNSCTSNLEEEKVLSNASSSTSLSTDAMSDTEDPLEWETEEIPPPSSLAEDKDKYLIFTTGSKTYSPHQIGFKRIKTFPIPTRIETGPTLRERIERQEQIREMRYQEPNWLDFDAVADMFDTIDHLIDLNGHIIGMGLSPDHRYLYVNSRPWPANCVIDNPLSPPPIAQEIDLHVIDLTNLKEVGTMLRSHRAYTPNDECFFIFLDVSHQYVASGAEDKHGYIWERHYGVCLARLPHSDVVNSVAFNPRDPEMIVTVSDDHMIKVWRSRRRCRELGIDLKTASVAKELRKVYPKNEAR